MGDGQDPEGGRDGEKDGRVAETGGDAQVEVLEETAVTEDGDKKLEREIGVRMMVGNTAETLLHFPPCLRICS